MARDFCKMKRYHRLLSFYTLTVTIHDRVDTNTITKLGKETGLRVMKNVKDQLTLQKGAMGSMVD